jgi:hypothetical protein
MLLAEIIAATTLASGGCRSCSSCHDYDPPVANCNCDAYGTHRAGSAGGCAGGSCQGCNSGGYVDGAYSGDGYPADESYSAEGTMTDEPMQNAVGQP